MVAIIQLAITLGATVGGTLYDSTGSQATFAASAHLLICAVFLIRMTSRYV